MKIIFLIICIQTCFFVLNAISIEVITEQYPPFSYENNNIVGGIATDNVQKVLKQLNIEVNIRIMRWSSAYRKALREKNVLLYSVGRTVEREDKFHWIGVVAPFDIYLYKLKSRKDIEIKDFNSIKDYKVGLVKDDMRDQFFSKYKDITLIRFSNTKDLIEALNDNIIDVIPVAELNFPYILQHLKYDADNYEKIYHLSEIEQEGLYMVLSKKTDNQTVEAFKKAYHKVFLKDNR